LLRTLCTNANVPLDVLYTLGELKFAEQKWAQSADYVLSVLTDRVKESGFVIAGNSS